MDTMKTMFRIAIAAVMLCAMCAVALGAPSIHKNNIRTASHVAISGVPIMIVPPRGAVSARTFRGFEDAARGIKIQAVAVSQPYSSAIDDPELLSRDGISITEKTEAIINGRSATLYRGKTEDEEISAQVLVLANGTSSIFIYGLCRGADAGASSAVRDSILSVCIPSANDAKPSRQSDGYRLSTDGTPLTLASESNYTRTYRDGDVATLSVTQHFVKEIPTDRKRYALDTMDEFMSSIDHEIVSTSNVTIGGSPGVEVIANFVGHMRRARTAHGGRVNRPVQGTAYVVTLFDQLGPEPRIFTFMGRSLDDAEGYSAMFKRVVSTFRIERQR